MTRIDWIVLNRLASRIGVTVLIFYGIIMLAESLDTWRFNFVADNYGLPMAALMVAMSAVRWTIKTLPVTVLMGAILGFLAIALGGETVSTIVNRGLYPTPPGQVNMQTPAGEIWLEQRSGDLHYVMMATGMQPGGALLGNVTIFRLNGGDEDRIEAPEAQLQNGAWLLPRAIIRNAHEPARTVYNYRLRTTSSAAEISLKLASTEDMTFFELADLLRAGVADSSIRNAATMRLIKLLALPLVLTGSLFIAFAFTAGYRRSSSYGPAVLYGVVLGFVVFVITEMADRAGSTGVLDPTFAAVGPAFVAIVIGVTVLLHKEDGRA